jgi:hypothetical protein
MCRAHQDQRRSEITTSRSGLPNVFGHSTERCSAGTAERTCYKAEAVVDVARKAAAHIGNDDVELIGGSSRIPLIQKALKQGLKVPAVRRSLQAEEAIAVGAAYGVQLLLNQSRLRPVNVSGDGELFNVTLKCGNETQTRVGDATAVVEVGAFRRIRISPFSDWDDEISLLRGSCRGGEEGAAR